MKDDVKKYVYGTLIVFVVGVLTWLGIVFVNACGFSFACNRGALAVERTPIPTLIPATMPAPKIAAYVPQDSPGADAGHEEGPARPSNPGEPGEAVTLKGDAAAGKTIFAGNCQVCHGAEGKGGVTNPGAAEGVVPALNPAPENLKDDEARVFAENIARFVQHGSTPAGKPVLAMPAWGDTGALSQQQIADVIAYVISLNP